MTINEQHYILGAPIMRTTNTSAGINERKRIILHYTAGRNADADIAWLRNPTSQASAHLVIKRDGAIIQLAPFDAITWHAGSRAVNAESIGIEMCNFGELRAVERGQYRTWFDEPAPTGAVVIARHRLDSKPSAWHDWPKDQLAAVDKVITALQLAYPSITRIQGHDEVYNGKRDPGPAFWDAYHALCPVMQ